MSDKPVEIGGSGSGPLAETFLVGRFGDEPREANDLMTPDMKRLCEAAKFAFDDVTEDCHGMAPYEAEAVVRAVLMALNEPSEGALKAARLRLYRYRHNDEPDVLDTNPMAWEAMIGHILGEPLKGDPVTED